MLWVHVLGFMVFCELKISTLKALRKTSKFHFFEPPNFINSLKNHMIDQASLYTQIEKKKDLQIDQVEIIAWVTSGCKKVQLLSYYLRHQTDIPTRI